MTGGRAASPAVDKTDFDGNVRTDARGYAPVRLPGWFDARDANPRYQLTAVGTRGWDARIGVWKPERDDVLGVRSDRRRWRSPGV